MIYSTRFAPTVNGYLHLGHVYNILVNQAEARRSGGTFGVRFDDNQLYWSWLSGRKTIERFKWDMRDDLDWLGIEPDYWHSDSEMLPQALELMRMVGYCPIPQPFCNYQGIEVVGVTHAFYPFTEALTAEKVVFDFMDGVTWAIRGIDLITEDCFYRYFVELFGLRRVRMTYIPRLVFDGDEVSKAKGNYKIKDFRKCGMTPEELISMLEVDCLKDVTGGWLVDNIRPRPVLGEWAKECLYAVHA